MVQSDMRKSLFVATVCVAILISGTLPSAADHWLGTWKLNLARSRYNPPDQAPRSQTIKGESVDGGMKLIDDRVDAQGRMTHTEYSAKFDGKDYPWPGEANADSIALLRIDDEYFETIWKLKGEVTITTATVVSKDRNTLTTTQSGKDAEGRTISNMTVYERQ